MNTDFYSAAISEVLAPTAPTSVAPVWRRCFAYIADSFLLGLVGTGIGNLLFNRLWQLGPWGILVGFFVGALYFAPMDCRLGNGQTLGKRLLKVRLVNQQGRPISFERALARYTIFAVPALLYGWRLPETRTPLIVTALVFVLVYWVGGSIFYFVLFERLNRQGLHDRAVGSYVVFADHEGTVETKPIPQLHCVILGSLLLVFTVGAAALNEWSQKQPVRLEFRHDASLLENMDGVQRAFLRESLTHGPNGGASKVLYISVTRNTKPLSEEAFAYDVVKTLLRSDQKPQGYDLIDVRLFYVYDIGIASHWNHREFEQSPSAWGGTAAR